jgi:hypothetical protein
MYTTVIMGKYEPDMDGKQHNMMGGCLGKDQEGASTHRVPIVVASCC